MAPSSILRESVHSPLRVSTGKTGLDSAGKL